MFKNLINEKSKLKIEYIPNIGCNIGLERLNWGDTRSSIRNKVKYQFIEDNRKIELPINNQSKRKDLEIRRDIYENTTRNEHLFFLCYNKFDNLSEIEIHSGATIIVKDVEFQFGNDIDEIAAKLFNVGENNIVVEGDSFIFKDFKITVASSGALGGKENGLDYFYGANDISHLIN